MTSPSAELPLPSRLPGQHELPSEDGVPMETLRHRAQMNHLIDALEAATREREDVFAGGNMFVYFSPRQLKNEHFRGPDFFVVLGADKKKERLSWVLWEEMRLPDVVVELTSPSTQREDYGAKKDTYERVWKTAVYVVYDPLTHRLDAWQLEAGRYVPATRDERGDVRVELLGLSLGVRDLPLSFTLGAPCLRWIDAQGEPLRTTAEVLVVAEAAERAARTAEDRASAAEDRVAALEAEIARLRSG